MPGAADSVGERSFSLDAEIGALQAEVTALEHEARKQEGCAAAMIVPERVDNIAGTLRKSGPMTPLNPSVDAGRQVQQTIWDYGAQSSHARRAFRLLHDQYLPFTYAIASRKAHPDDVDDILQETWVALWRRLEASEPIERFLSLLEAICRHKVADANERRFRRRRQSTRSEAAAGSPIISLDDPVDPSAPDGERWSERLESPEAAPVTAVLERERLDELWKLLDRLPDTWRMAVVYRFFNQMSVAETARVMRTTDDAVKKYVFRAVRRLREWMQMDAEFWLT